MAASKFELDQIRDYRPCWDAAQMQQAREYLDRLSARTGAKQTDQRRHSERRPYTVAVLVTQGRKSRLADGSRFMLHAIARNLSRSGLGLLVPLYFEPEIPNRDAPAIQSMTIFRDASLLEIGLRKACGSMLWLLGTVIRARTLNHDVLDVGVRFNSRISVDEDLDFS
jgi:hypothetical protein